MGNTIDQLVEKNEEYKQEIENCDFYELTRSGFFNKPKNREKFLDYYQIASNEFQRMVLIRAAFSQKSAFVALAQEHLKEELGHDSILAQHSKFTWDPVLEALAQWFVSKMLTEGDAERTVLVHLVSEADSAIFYKNISPFFLKNDPGQHFASHNELDPHHELMGIELLRQVNISDMDSLFEIQAKGWAISKSILNRLTDILTS